MRPPPSVPVPPPNPAAPAPARARPSEPEPATRALLDRAHQDLTTTAALLDSQPPNIRELSAAVDGAILVTGAAAELVAAVLRQVRAALAGRADPGTLADLVADLYTVRNSLAVAPTLLEPARDDLRRLTRAGETR